MGSGLYKQTDEVWDEERSALFPLSKVHWDHEGVGCALVPTTAWTEGCVPGAEYRRPPPPPPLACHFLSVFFFRASFSSLWRAT